MSKVSLEYVAEATPEGRFRPKARVFIEEAGGGPLSERIVRNADADLDFDTAEDANEHAARLVLQRFGFR